MNQECATVIVAVRPRSVKPIHPGYAAYPVRRLSESPAFRICRQRTRDLLRDNRRLEFLRALDRSTAPLTAMEAGVLREILARARGRRYHYVMTAGERDRCDGWRRNYEHLTGPADTAGRVGDN